MNQNRKHDRPQWLVRWLERHRHPVSRWLHFVGIPLTIACLPLAIVQYWNGEWSLWWRPATMLIAGYLLQWIGHRIEGNDMGEMILLKKWLGRPYVAISTKYTQQTHPSEHN